MIFPSAVDFAAGTIVFCAAQEKITFEDGC